MKIVNQTMKKTIYFKNRKNDPVGFMAAAEQGNAIDMYLYGDICASSIEKWSEDDRCPSEIVEYLTGISDGQQINIHFNSCGGDYFAGLAIYSLLKDKKSKKVAYVDGLAASIASVIMFAADEIHMRTGAQIMIHNPLAMGASGNAEELRTIADHLDVCSERVRSIYMENAAKGVDDAKMKDLMDAETWMEAADAQTVFKNMYADDTEKVAACASTVIKRYRNTPEKLNQEIKSAKLEKPEDWEKSNRDTERAKEILNDIDLI